MSSNESLGRTDPPVAVTGNNERSHALGSPVLSTFYRYLFPSLAGMVAMTSASLVDGLFIGNFVGIEALAAINLLIPVMALLFGVGLMLSIGGAVRCGKYLGEKNNEAASAIFSKTLTTVLLYSTVVIILGLIFETTLFNALGATLELLPLMSEYYRAILPFLLAQLGTIVLYFFIRLDGYPSLTAAALIVGAAFNIALDYLFIAVYQWGLFGAALATGLSQISPFLILLCYFFLKNRKLHYRLKQSQWSEVLKAAYNGISEFINEISAGIIIAIFNWMLIQRAGVEGVAAITVVNYLLMLGYMVFFAVSDTSQVMVSQNFGAKNALRIRQFLVIGSINIAVVSMLCIAVLISQSETLILMFVEGEDAEKTVNLAMDFVSYIWPAFLFAGVNMLISSYLTSIHLPFQSGVVALCRSLILPSSLLIVLYTTFDGYNFVYALALSEAATFVIAAAYFLHYRPKLVATGQS